MGDVAVAVVQPLVPHYRVPFFEALARREGIRLTVVADTHPLGSLTGIASSSVFPIEHAPHRSLGPFFLQRGTSSSARDPRFDVVVFNWSSRYPGLPRAVRRAARSGKGVVLWGHGFGITRPGLGHLVRDRLVRWADVCLLYGPTARESLIRRGLPADKLLVAPNAVDQEPIREATAHWTASDRLVRFRESVGVARRPVMLYLSRLESDKRPELVLEALALLRGRDPEPMAVFIGGGGQQHILRKRAASLGLEASVRFLGPEYDEMRIAPWALNSRCVVHPGKLGLTIFHAFGYGLPVVTGRDPRRQAPEVEALCDDGNGLLYEDGSVDDLAAQVGRLLADDDLHRRLSKGARDTVRGSGGRTLEAMVEGFVAGVRLAAERARARR